MKMLLALDGEGGERRERRVFGDIGALAGVGCWGSAVLLAGFQRC